MHRMLQNISTVGSGARGEDRTGKVDSIRCARGVQSNSIEDAEEGSDKPTQETEEEDSMDELFENRTVEGKKIMNMQTV